MNEFICFLPVRVIFGYGELNLLGKYVRNLGNKAFLVMDPYLEEAKAGKMVITLLEKSSIDVVTFTDIRPNPTYTLVDEAAQIAKEKCCDVVIGIGGGSTLDTAKGVAVVAANPGQCREYIKKEDQPRSQLSTAPFPIIAVPTTAGTGSEATPYAVLTDPETRGKRAIVNQLIFPQVAIVDPELMISMPPDLTAFTGIDTLAHALESYINANSHPYSELLALEAIRLVAASLPAAVANGTNREARSAIAWANTLAGMAIAHVGPTLPHALAQAVGGFCNAPHGQTLAACLPKIMRFMLTSNFDKFARIAETMDVSCAMLPLRERAEKSIDLVQRLLQDCSAETSFSACDLKEKDIDKVTDMAIRFYPADVNNPRQATREDVRKLCQECMK